LEDRILVVYGWLRSDGQAQDTTAWLTPIRN